MKTTLNKIRAQAPGYDGWKKLLKHLEKTEADDETLLIRTVLESNGVDAALWCLRTVDGHDREIRLYAVWCARQVQHLMTDPRSVAALDFSEKYANGAATLEELIAAWTAARDAARAAKRDAAWAAAWAAACAALWCSARAAAWAAARDAARAAKRDAAWAAARAAQDAVRAAQAQELMRLCLEIEAANSIKGDA